MQFPVNQDVDTITYAAQCLKNLKGKGFASLNVCSIINKIDSICILVEQSGIDVLCISESFLKPDIADSEVSISQYHLLRGDRDQRSGKRMGGGLICYIHEDLHYSLIPDSHLCTPHVETLWVRINLKQARPIYLCNINRPPDATQQAMLVEIRLISG